jgi:hypothetical protein
MIYPPITYRLFVEKCGISTGWCQNGLLKHCGEFGILTKEIATEFYSDFYWDYMGKVLFIEEDYRKYTNSYKGNTIEIFFSLYITGKQSKVDKIVEECLR